MYYSHYKSFVVVSIYIWCGFIFCGYFREIVINVECRMKQHSVPLCNTVYNGNSYSKMQRNIADMGVYCDMAHPDTLCLGDGMELATSLSYTN